MGRAFYLEKLDMTPQVLFDRLGRVLMAALFVKAVPEKLTNFSVTV